MSKNKRDKLSGFISLVLRHKPEAANIKLDEHGYALVKDLIKGTNESGRSLNLDSLKSIVKEDKKGRYSFSEDFSKIRANQGHSIPVNVGMESKTPPDILYHGTAKKSVDSIFMSGIEKRGRNFVHLSSDLETAVKVGSRHGAPVVLKLNAKKMVEDGIEFLVSENGVWQVDFVSAKYIEISKKK